MGKQNKVRSIAQKDSFLRKELDLLYALDAIRDRVSNTEELAVHVQEKILSLIPCEVGAIFITSKVGDFDCLASTYQSEMLFNKSNYIFLKHLLEQSVSEGRIRIFKEKLFHLSADKTVEFEEILCYPLIMRGVLIGGICLAEKKNNQPFNISDIKLLKAIGSQIDSAFLHLQTKEEMQIKLKTVQTLYAVDEIRDQSKSLQDLLHRITTYLFESIPAHSVGLFFNDIAHNSFELRANYPDTTQFSKDHYENARQSLVKQSIINKGSIIYYPIVLNDEPLGVISIDQKKKNSRSLEILEAVVSQADSAIVHARTIEELKERSKELDTLYAIDKIRDSIEDFDEMLLSIQSKLVETLEAEIGFIMLFNDKKKVLELKISTTKSKEYKTIIDDLSHNAMQSKELIMINDLNSKIKTAMAIPLVLNDKIIGVFGVLNSKSKQYFEVEEKRLLEAIASQADTAIFEDFEKKKIKNIFKRYVAESVVDEMLKDEKDYLKGKRKFMTVLFADIRDFTSIGENMTPEELVVTINDYLEAMTNVIMTHKGTLDKFVGDEVMALFGAPLEMKNSATIAVKTAIDMQKAMKKLQRKWKKEGKKPSSIGIGINTGFMVAGNIGCEKMTDYTVLGDNVNLGCRLCDIAKGDTILISGKTYEQLKKEKAKFKYTKLKPIKVKGKVKAIPIYTVDY